MLAMMPRLFVPLVLFCAVGPLCAQTTLAELQQQFANQSQALAGGKPSREQRDQLLDQQIARLRKFTGGEATGDDRWNGRLMLADLLLARGDRTGAGAALREIDTAAAPALLLATAASMAQHLNLRELRDAMVAAAIGKAAPVPERLAMARLLMTVLREVDAGEKVFTEALAAAGDDEQRAFVRWHRADALRDREDLPDNAGFEALGELAKDLPATYWGSVAKDRLRATQLQLGDDAIAFRAPLLGGGEIHSAALAGKTVVLSFWSLGDHDTPVLMATLQQLRKLHGDRLAVVGICLDRDPAAIAAAVKELNLDFPLIADGKGSQNDVALRWFVEGPVLHVIDGKGKVRGLGLHTGTADARSELQELVERTVKS
jgi:peroxiredoxin